MTTQKNNFHTKLYAFGSNGSGQLGVGHQDDLSEPQICSFSLVSSVEDQLELGTESSHVLHGNSIEKIVAGGNHTLVLTGTGMVYAAGLNADGRCGLDGGSESVMHFTPLKWAKGRRITDVAATWEASFFIEDHRRLWVCGTGLKAELGLGRDVVQASEPRMVCDVEGLGVDGCEMVAVKGSMSHVVLLLSDGRVYGWGNCRKGQLGEQLKEKKVIWEPERLGLLSPILSFCVARDFSLFREATNDLTILGDFLFFDTDQIGETSTSADQIVAGWTTVYVLRHGLLQGYGQGKRGQLPPAGLSAVASFAAGSEHCVALLTDGTVAAWGWGEHGNCGSPVDDRGNVVDRYNTISIPIEDGHRIVGVGAGCSSSFVWTTD